MAPTKAGAKRRSSTTRAEMYASPKMRAARVASPGRQLRPSIGTPLRDVENDTVSFKVEDGTSEATAHRTPDPFTDILNTAHNLISTLERDASGKPLGLHTLEAELSGYNDELDAKFGDQKDEELVLDWSLYRSWPEGIVQEEELLLDYFRKLKFIYLEQETKLRFLADLQDDPETGQEPQILSAADVAHREQQCKRVKQQLVAAKIRVRDLRAHIDMASEALSEPWHAVESGANEASALIASINDMDLELAKIKAAEGTLGAMTTEEAEAHCDAQIVEMQSFDDQTTQAMHDIERTKKELADGLRSLDRLRLERSAAEKYANDVKLGMGSDGGRDLELERLCARYATTLECLQRSLSLVAVRAPTRTDLHIDIGSEPSGRASRPRSRRSSHVQETHTLALHFDRAGGQLESYEVLHDDEHVALTPEARALADAALRCNNVQALVQGIWQVLG